MIPIYQGIGNEVKFHKPSMKWSMKDEILPENLKPVNQ